MTSPASWAPPDERFESGIIHYHDGEYRVHKAWTANPCVFVRYVASGKLVERKLPRHSTKAIKVAIKFRNEARRD